MSRCEHGEMVCVKSGLRAPFQWALASTCTAADPGAFCGPGWCAGTDEERVRAAERRRIAAALRVRAGEFPAMTERAKALMDAAAWLESEVDHG